MAVVDADYRFRYISVGSAGAENDASVWGNWNLSKAIDSGDIKLPPPGRLLGTDALVPHVFVADDAFPLKPYLMKPYSSRNLTHEQSAFNYRLSRARRIVENAFGILAARWRIFGRPIQCKVETVDNVIWVCVLLHNFLRAHDGQRSSFYMPPAFVDREESGEDILGGWRELVARDCGLSDIKLINSNASSGYARAVRQRFLDYFNHPVGIVEWQERVISRV